MSKWSTKGEKDPKTGKPKTWQKPKADHPWRQYNNKRKPAKDRGDIIPLKEYLESLVENWDKMEVTTFGDMGNRTYTLKTASQKKAAAYICGVLKRNYVQK
jgi:hypothetical protein